MTTAGTVLLVLTVLFWLVLCGLLNSVVGRTATGDAAMGLAMEWIYVCVLVCLTWICLSGLLLAASSQKILPDWVSVAAVFICPASGIAAIASVYLLSETPARWPMAISFVIPGLIAGYVFAVSRPALRAIAGGLPVSLAVWGVVAALSIAVAPAVSRKMDEVEKKRAERSEVEHRAQTAVSAGKREAGLAKLKGMTPDQPLTSWYDLLDPKNGVRAEALEALRKVERRQGDIQELLTNGIPFYMTMAPELDLKPTPELCRAAQSYLEFVAKSKQAGGQDPYPYQGDEYIDDSLEAVRWFTSHGCDCDAAIGAIEGNVRKHYLDSAARRKMLERLAGLRRAGGAR